MDISASAALQSLSQAQEYLNAAARRITDEATATDAVSLSSDAISLIQAGNDFAAGIKAVQTADEVQQTAIGIAG